MSIVKDVLLILLLLIIFIKYVSLRRKVVSQQEFFINTLSHDLRISTIAQLRGVELLEKCHKSELINEIKESCKFSLEIINSLLNTYKFEKGESVLNFENFKISNNLFSINTSLQQFIGEKNLQICKNIDSQLIIYADKTNIQKAFQILLNTAILYANKNSLINIVVRKKMNNIEFSIFYKGQFLSEEEYNRMFSKKLRFSAVGQGIKIQLLKKIIDFHRGFISAKKIGKEFVMFSFSIPQIKTSENKKSQYIPKLIYAK